VEAGSPGIPVGVPLVVTIFATVRNSGAKMLTVPGFYLSSIKIPGCYQGADLNSTSLAYTYSIIQYIILHID
jgi:hypothetical protein